MTSNEFDVAVGAFRRRQPFVAFSIEFASGTRIAIVHPEAVDKVANMCIIRFPDGTRSLFAADSVTRLHG
jgi:hypothetical protein